MTSDYDTDPTPGDAGSGFTELGRRSELLTTLAGLGYEEPTPMNNLPNRPSHDAEASGYAGVVERNIKALLERRRQHEQEQGVQARLAEGITRFTGSMRFVYIHLVIFGLWIVVNLGWLPVKPFDPSFTVLAMAASVEAIFLSTFVLISQNRSAELANKRAELDPSKLYTSYRG